MPRKAIYLGNWHSKPDINATGGQYAVRGHWGGDFEGNLTYCGHALAILTDKNGVEREICYLNGVEFRRMAKP